jgi:uncharacterized membrane protein HdeD (DUF308 family)
VYLASVLLLMALFPVSSIAADHLYFHPAAPLLSLTGKWFVFWGAGVRLFLAGLRQLFQPKFTAQQIFDLHHDDVLPVVRELGVANLATGTAGMVSLAQPGFVLPVALIAAIFYGIAGLRHAITSKRNRNENIAMLSDLAVSLIFAAYVGLAAIR